MSKPSTHVRQALLQLLDSFQCCILRLGVLQQSSHIEHVIQVGLNLHLQFIALSVLQLLLRAQRQGNREKKKQPVISKCELEML